ncbi:hypothetical protein K461DRAFT_221539 [Myriangium duriaei CBS 260.36]|uniref:Origin recognition complex subunit 3 winged helix C-terminal domain-containing protein n=1 Tax=Myriangium duriaei CBS 260.36 TaxID=1168546 RepID=A0A9P4JBR2_9PEZI|nr:hypothetical protein K461DRAFT_221539 [Myriangium duriaei CBS 260.36]
MDYDTCFVYKPGNSEAKPERPTKRRKTELHGLQSSWPRRRELYQNLWSRHDASLQDSLLDLDRATVTRVTDFVLNSANSESGRVIDSAIIVTGPNLAQQAAITTQIQHAVRRETRSCFVSFNAGEATNIKAVLKRINTVALSADTVDDDEDGDEQITTGRRGTKLLNYDLRILQQAAEEQNLSKVVIAFQDCEAIDGTLLSDAVELFSCWKDRIPFVLVFGVATSVENLQVNLSKRAIRCIRGCRFDVAPSDVALEDLFAQFHPLDSCLWLGSGLCRTIVDRQKDFLQNPHSMIDSVQYAYMTHFYANALSIFLDPDLTIHDVAKDHFDALRYLPSFMRYIEKLLDQDKKNASAVKTLLESDAVLLHECKSFLKEARRVMGDLVTTARLWASLADCMKGLEKSPVSEVTMLALSGTILDSPKMTSFFLHLKRCSSDILQQMLKIAIGAADAHASKAFTEQQADLLALMQEQKEGDGPLRSEEDIQNSTRRTTVVAKKIELSRAKTSLTKADAAYSEILNQFLETLQSFLSEKLINPKELPLNEIFFFDLKSPHRTVFTPRPRHALERALAAPHDYLNCTCCRPEEDQNDQESSLSATQPPTAILYQLYLESGQLINASDLRSAFVAILGDKIEDEQVLAATFQRSLAELSHLGLVKATKKRPDHIIKQSWRGL